MKKLFIAMTTIVALASCGTEQSSTYKARCLKLTYVSSANSINKFVPADSTIKLINVDTMYAVNDQISLPTGWYKIIGK